MKKNVLVLASRNAAEIIRVEKALLSLGFDTLRVMSVQDALYRAKTEIFSSIVCVDAKDGSVQRELVAGLVKQPLGIVTPVVMLGEAVEPAERSGLTSILDQYFPLSTDPLVIAEFCGETHELRTEKAKRGVLGAISVPQVLAQASQVRLSGAIVMEKGSEKCIVYMEEGLVVFASSNRDENRFGEFLVRQGMISKEAFVRATTLLKESGKRLGHILVEEGVIKPQVLQTLIQSQVKHIVYTVFDWLEGEFFILLDEKSSQTEAVARFEVPTLLLEGIRFRFTEETLEKYFQPLTQMISLAIPLKDVGKHIHLGKNENDLLRIISEKRSVDELLNLNSFSRAESLKLLYAFKVLGLLIFEAPVPEKASLKAFSPKRVERTEAVNELFEKKVAPSPSRPAAKSFKGEPGSMMKVSWWVRTGLAMVAASIPFWIITFVDFSTGEKELPPLPTAVPIPTVQPTAVPTEFLPSPTPINVAVQQKKVPRVDSLEARFRRLMNLAASQKGSGDLRGALATYRRASKLRPRNLKARLEIGNLLFDLGQLKEAKRSFWSVVRIDPTNAEPYLALGTLYVMEGDKGRAVGTLRKYLALVKRTPKTHYRIAEAQKVLQRLESNR